MLRIQCEKDGTAYREVKITLCAATTEDNSVSTLQCGVPGSRTGWGSKSHSRYYNIETKTTARGSQVNKGQEESLLQNIKKSTLKTV